jgi:hypothetical protein
MSDVTAIFQVNKEIREDENRPVFAREIKVFDEVDYEIALYEADHQIDDYMEKFRSRFNNPETFEALVGVYRLKFRGEIKAFADAAQKFFKEAGLDKEYGYESGDDDGNV